MVTLSESYAKTIELVEAGKIDAAAKEYSENFSSTVKKMFSNTAKTYPLRFSKVDNWCEWMKDVYVKTRQAEDALAAGDKDKALAALAAIREHMNVLHVRAQALKSNDYIYALEQQAKKSQPDAAAMSRLAAGLAQAAPSAKAKAEAESYTGAKQAWEKGAGAALKDGKIEAGEIKRLRADTSRFYKAYGIQFE